VTAFTHIAHLGAAPLVIMASKPSGIKTYAEFEDAAKKRGQMDFGSGGPGSIGHIHGELLKKIVGLNMVHVPYRGGAPMTTDLIAGIVPVGIDVITAFVQYFKSGQIVPLAVTSANRSPLAPDVPSVVESGHRKLVLDNFFGLSGPAKMPADVVVRLNTAVNEILAGAEFRKRMVDLGITTSPVSQPAFAAFVKEQVAQLAPTVKGAGVKL
jgi:tripartite-type tricarboxylate transporter receptor subunit TctC